MCPLQRMVISSPAPSTPRHGQSWQRPRVTGIGWGWMCPAASRCPAALSPSSSAPPPGRGSHRGAPGSGRFAAPGGGRGEVPGCANSAEPRFVSGFALLCPAANCAVSHRSHLPSHSPAQVLWLQKTCREIQCPVVTVGSLGCSAVPCNVPQNASVSYCAGPAHLSSPSLPVYFQSGSQFPIKQDVLPGSALHTTHSSDFCKRKSPTLLPFPHSLLGTERFAMAKLW